MKFKFGVQNLSYCRPGCHRSPKPSGERTIQRPPESPNAWPHAFSQGLMNVETPAPPGLVAPSRPRADSAPPLSRCPRAPRSARANSTPVDSCRLLSIRLLTHAAPRARPRRAEPPQCRVDGNRRESTGIGLRGEAGRKDPHKSRRSRLCVRRSRLRENSSWVQQEKTAPEKPRPQRMS